ncbi:probable boron transporter 6 [Phtheirospermum japonicum]|uniref:Probable boron transporter 6 n=1 Tax=Phtheirospermum japonicum TaxID=374723 RepID=A0A830CPN4_9LAMI|nr:probable boron transporter 6 [Phtheirospermum japonicum]
MDTPIGSNHPLAPPDIVVARDPSGQFKTIGSFCIYVKVGVYEEQVKINRVMSQCLHLWRWDRQNNCDWRQSRRMPFKWWIKLANMKEVVLKHDEGGTSKGKFDPEKCIGLHLPDLPVQVSEQRVSNFLQSMLVGLAVCAMPGEDDATPCSLRRRFKVIEEFHASFMESMLFKYIFIFTMFYLRYLMMCFGITRIPIVGILFHCRFPFDIHTRAPSA